jgi:hypothetical protein
MIIMDSLLHRFAQDILAATPTQIGSDPTLGGRLVLEREGAITVAYAPFEYVNPAARVVLVGITPGRQQAIEALLAARSLLAAGQDNAAVAKGAKETASFAGTMRASLVRMLDHIGLHQWLEIPSCGDLFGAKAGLVHYTSALRYPVYLNGQNYSGNPEMTSHPLLRRYVRECLAAEVQQLPDAVWIPLGPRPASALKMLARDRLINPARILDGVPHPSGANAERISYFLGQKLRCDLSNKTNSTVIDAARERLIGAIESLCFPRA